MIQVTLNSASFPRFSTVIKNEDKRNYVTISNEEKGAILSND